MKFIVKLGIVVQPLLKTNVYNFLNRSKKMSLEKSHILAFAQH